MLPDRIFPGLVVAVLVLGVLSAGCSSPAAEQPAGTLIVLSEPSGAEVYFDNEYRGTSPVTVRGVAAGTHHLELRMPGMERWDSSVSIVPAEPVTVTAVLVRAVTTMPVTIATVAEPAVRNTPQIHVDGYWSWPQAQRVTSPSQVLIHVDAFNVGEADAREVTVGANLYYRGRMVCWNTIYLGTLRSGDHLARDAMVSCTLPSPLDEPDLVVRFENVVVRP
jgi:hypothetical protein